MLKTVTGPRVQASKTPAEVRGMLHDIATVLRLTAMVKAEMINDRAEADRKHLDRCRSARTTEPALA